MTEQSKPKRESATGQDGIEVHFDEKRGRLELACEPDSFALFRDLAAKELRGLDNINFGKVQEIEILDVDTCVARREAPRSRLLLIGFVTIGLGIVATFLVGAVTLVGWLLKQ